MKGGIMEIMIFEKGVWRLEKAESDSPGEAKAMNRDSYSDPLKNLTLYEQEDFHERAAIMEFDASLPREEAERHALRIILAKRNLN